MVHTCCLKRALPRCGHLDLDLLVGTLKQGLDAGARWRAAGHHPGIPDLVHLVDGADIGKPDRSSEQLRLVGPGLRQERIDEREDLAGLLGDTLTERLVRDQPGEIDGVAVHDHLAHAPISVDALNAHVTLLCGASMISGAVTFAVSRPSEKACAITLRMTVGKAS